MRVLDLFSGIGGFSLGLERVGFETVAFCEIEDYPRKVLKHHWPSVPVFNDITKLSKEKLDELGSIDIVCGGFPCQDISAAGNKVGVSGERSGLWFEFARIIAETNPKFAIIENSPMLRSRGLDQVLQSLWKIGYDAEWHVIPASAFGAPHRRERLWIIAYPMRLRFQGSWEHITPSNTKENAYREADRLKHAVQEGSLPYVCGGHDGVPERVDKPAIKALGNSVCPDVVEYIGDYIRRGYEHRRV